MIFKILIFLKMHTENFIELKKAVLEKNFGDVNNGLKCSI